MSFVKFSPNGKYVLTGTLDDSIKLWDFNKGKCVKHYRGKPQSTYGILSMRQIAVAELQGWGEGLHLWTMLNSNQNVSSGSESCSLLCNHRVHTFASPFNVPGCREA